MAQKRGDMAGRSWEEIPQDSWKNIIIRVDEADQWHVRFDYEARNGRTYTYPEEEITFDQFIDIYDMAGELDQEIEIEGSE